jgi:rfaE bifunctional protein nucleotidyltransferase chain/domain
MDKIVSTEQINEISAVLHKQNKRIVLSGGCFDLLHVGHITFLEEAKKQGDCFIVMLESDETIKKSKGNKRPINTQADRAKILAALSAVDYIVLLKPEMSNKEYDDLVIAIKPAIIATTSGDRNRHHKERTADLVNAKVIDVTMPISDKSTTAIIRLLDEL